MSTNTPECCVMIATCICAKDGVISEAEEHLVFELVSKKFPDFSRAAFEVALDKFFDSNEQIEDYLARVDEESLQNFVLELSQQSASADGLDPKENIALEKAYLIWGRDRHA